MITTSEPIGRFVALLNLEKDIITDKSVRRSIEDIVDLLKIRLTDKSIEEVSESLMKQVFELRFEIIEWLAHENKSIREYFELINEKIAYNLQAALFSELSSTVSDSLLAYEKIASPIFDKMGIDNFENFIEAIQDQKPNYETINMFTLHPSPRIKYLKNWIDSSLEFEVGLIISELVLIGQIKMSKARVKNELIRFINKTTVRYGANSIFTGFWIPDEKDNTKLINNMRILAATFELDNNIYYKTSKDDLSKLINN